MGYYIECPNSLNKAAQISKKYGATGTTEAIARASFFPGDENYGKAVIVVVGNGMFEAAAFAYGVDEFDAFTGNPFDRRPKWFLFMDRDKAKELTGYKGA